MDVKNNCKIALSQLNYTAGDMDGNSKKIIDCILKSKEENAEIVLFQHNAILGFELDDVIDRFPFLIEENRKYLNKVSEFTTDITAVIGFTEILDNAPHNFVAILQNGRIQNIIKHSCDVPNIKINDMKFGFLFDYEKISECDFPSLDIVVASVPVLASKSEMIDINRKLKNLSEKLSKPVVFVNGIGSTDCVSYCGESAVYYSGELTSRAKSFEEDLLIYDLKANSGIINDSSISNKIRNEFSLDYEDDLEFIYKVVIQGIRDYFRKNGLKRAVLGLSGGLDSTVSAVLLVDALGKENVFGISMPSNITSAESKSDARVLAANLGIGFDEVPIKTIVADTKYVFDEMFKNVEKYWNCRYQKSFTTDNIQARARATYLWGISNEFGQCIPIATSDKSEAYMGYATVNGDMSGGFAPIADITKTKLFALAKWLNKNRAKINVIPESVIQKSPGAELAIDENTGKPLRAEDALMPYEFLDEVIWRVENNHETFESMLNSQFQYEKSYSVSKETKEEWLTKFFRRMQSATFKWSIMPPSVVIDRITINGAFYKHPISSNINFRISSEENM